MPKGSDNPFPSLLLVEGSTPSSPSSGDQRLFIDTADHMLKRVDSSGTVTTVEGGGGGAALSALLNYTAATDLANNTAVSATTWTTVGSAQSFTTTGSAIVTIEAGGFIQVEAASNWTMASALLIDGATRIMLGGAVVVGSTGANPLAGASRAVLTGLSAGSHTVAVQIWTSVATNMWCRPSTHPNEESLRITVVQ